MTGTVRVPVKLTDCNRSEGRVVSKPIFETIRLGLHRVKHTDHCHEQKSRNHPFTSVRMTISNPSPHKYTPYFQTVSNVSFESINAPMHRFEISYSHNPSLHGHTASIQTWISNPSTLKCIGSKHYTCIIQIQFLQPSISVQERNDTEEMSTTTTKRCLNSNFKIGSGENRYEILQQTKLTTTRGRTTLTRSKLTYVHTCRTNIRFWIFTGIKHYSRYKCDSQRLSTIIQQSIISTQGYGNTAYEFQQKREQWLFR